MAAAGDRILTSAMLVFAFAGAARLGPASSAPFTPADSAERARALHVLNRLTFGPRPGDVDRLIATGIDRFVDGQLHPERINDRELQNRVKSYDILRTSPAELARLVGDQQRQRQQRQRAMPIDSSERAMIRESSRSPKEKGDRGEDRGEV